MGRYNIKYYTLTHLFILPLFIALQFIDSIHPLRDQRSNDALSGGKCRMGWTPFENKCYKVVSPRNLEMSKNRCQDLKAQLAFVEDETIREGESPSTLPVNNSSVFTFLTTIVKNDSYPRLYYVNISSDLMRQYKLRAHQELTAATYGASIVNGDLSEHIDIDYPMSDLWLPSDDKDFTNDRFSVSNNTLDSSPGFALAFSRQHGRWGLLPISPSRRAASICEAASVSGSQGSDAQQHKQLSSTRPQSPPIENKKSSANELQPVGPRSTHSMLDQDKSDSAGGNHEKDPITSSTNINSPSPQAESIPSALFRDLPHNQSVVLGSTAEMRCSSIESDSIVSWTFNGKNLTQSNRVRQNHNGWIKIEHVRNSDGGNYTCTIHSGLMSESRSARLEIVERPHQPEYITAELLDKLSTSVRIKWTPGFNGNSPITKYMVEMKTVTGDSSGSDNINNSEMTSIGSAAGGQWEIAKANISADQTSVIIPDLKPARKYIFRIRAANRVGTGDPSVPTRNPIEVPVQPPSMAPENISGTPRSSNSISIQWSPPPLDSQNGLIKGYRIRHKLAGYASDTDWYTNEISETAHLNFVLEDLITWQNYEIQIAAENDKGVGPYSASIFVRTKEGKPDSGPRNVQAEASSPTVIKVNWNPPLPQHINGINQGYKVQVWLDNPQTQLAKEVVVQHNSLMPLQVATIDGLSPYTEYYVTVKCFTNGGDGVPNEELVSVKTKQDLPEAVESIGFLEVLDKSLKVIWRPPRRVNGELNHYTLEYSETSSADKKMLKKFPAGTTEAKITDLLPQTSYTFKIYAHTDFGQGPGKINVTTTSVPPVLPEPPSNLVPLNIGAYTVSIQFEPGFDGNAAIDRWVAEALIPSNGDYKPRWQTIYVSTNHSHGNILVVRNLRPYTRYKIRLTPSNVVGSSRYPSEPTPEFLTSQTEPEHAPKDLSIEEIRSNSAVAHWSPLSNNLWLGQPKGYNLTWFESSNSTINHYFINDTRADSFLIKDLEEFTDYVFRIYAVNGAGQSPPSEAVNIQTLEDVPSAGPSNVTAGPTSSTGIQVSWGPLPKRHRNGIIKGYRIQYQALKQDAPLLHKTIEGNNTKHANLNDLKPFTLYQLAVAAYTTVGDGIYSPVVSAQTLEDTPGLPQNISSPSVSQTTARILWDPPEDPNGEILGYKVTYHSLTDGNREIASQELHHNERTFKATNLKPDTHYVFTVTAKTKEGWGQQASMLLYTYDSELRANLPFFRESWFVILCACSSVVITIIVTALLFIQTKSYKYKQNSIKSTSQDRLGDAGFTIEDESNSHYNNGFGLLPNTASHRRSNGAISQSTANFTLPKTPPRPHPGSAVYSDDDDDVFEDPVEKPSMKSATCRPGQGTSGASQYDSSGDSLTEKPSEISSSPAPESPESNEEEYVNVAQRQLVNHYANVTGTFRSQRSWKRGGPSTSSGKQYGIPGGSHSNHGKRTKPKLPQRPAPSVPKVPAIGTDLVGSGGQSSSDSQSNRQSTMVLGGTSNAQHRTLNHNGASIYGDSPVSQQLASNDPRQHSEHEGIAHKSNKLILTNTGSSLEGTSPLSHTHANNHQPQQNGQQADLLNNQMMTLNGGRIIVDNMAGSRAPLPGFTSFV